MAERSAGPVTRGRRARLAALALALAAVGHVRPAGAHGDGLHYHLARDTRWSYRLVSTQVVKVGGRASRAQLELDVLVRVRKGPSDGPAELVLSVKGARGEATVDGRPAAHLSRLLAGLHRATLVFSLDERGRLAKSEGWQGAPPPLAPMLQNVHRTLELALPRFSANASVRPGDAWEAMLGAPARPGQATLRTQARYQVASRKDAELALRVALSPRIEVPRPHGVTASGSGQGQGELVFDLQAGALHSGRLQVSYEVDLKRGTERLKQDVTLSLEVRPRLAALLGTTGRPAQR